MSKLRNVITLIIIFFCAVSIGGIFFAKPAYATHQIGWVFFKNNTVVENRTTSYVNPVWNAVDDYDRTVLTVSHGSGPIRVVQGSYGTIGWDAGAEPYSAGTRCVTWPGLQSTGYCNKTTHKVDFAYIYFNDSYGSYNMPEYGARHELGHVFGLRHESCGNNGVMEEGSCRPNVPQQLNAHDIFEIDVLY